MGAGKTTVGKALASRLHIAFMDTDLVFARLHDGITTGEFISRFGLEIFRPEEQAALKSIAETAGPFVVATGGGVPVFHGNMEIMKSSGLVVHLNIPLDAISARMTPEELAKRPVWSSKTRQQLEDLYNERLPIYNQAHIIVDAARHTSDIVDEINTKLQLGIRN